MNKRPAESKQGSKSKFILIWYYLDSHISKWNDSKIDYPGSRTYSIRLPSLFIVSGSTQWFQFEMCFPINGDLQSLTATITLYNAILTKVTSYHVLVTLSTINLNNKEQNSVMQHYNFMQNWIGTYAPS